MIFVTRATCPACSSPDYQRSRTENGGDGSTTKKVTCRRCLQRYLIVSELPETGNGALDVR